MIFETADVMAESGLRDKGYEYLVIDDCWSLRERDEKRPSCAGSGKFPHGMKAVADYVHSKGLKFGMYSCAGNMTVPATLAAMSTNLSMRKLSHPGMLIS